MIYIVFQVILLAEDGEYIQAEYLTEDRANQEADKLEQDSGDGQSYIVESLRKEY
jgi:hypothetical protein